VDPNLTFPSAFINTCTRGFAVHLSVEGKSIMMMMMMMMIIMMMMMIIILRLMMIIRGGG